MCHFKEYTSYSINDKLLDGNTEKAHISMSHAFDLKCLMEIRI